MILLAEIARWSIAVPTGLLFALCVIGNWSILIGLLLGRVKPGSSLVLPFLGAPLGIVFLLSLPIPGAARFWWIPLLAEPMWLIGVMAGFAGLRRRLATTPTILDPDDATS